MKKNLAQIINVYGVFATLTTKHFNNFSVSYKIAKAAKELESHRDFYMAEEKKLVETHAVKEKDGRIKIIDGNRIEFKTPEDGIKFNEEVIKLQKTEVDVFEPFEIRVSDFKEGEMNITPREIIALEDFVIFKDEDPVPAKTEA